MRFYPLFLYANKKIGSDQLNNPIYEKVLIGESIGRFSSWSDKEVALDKREVTVNSRKILTRAPKAFIDEAESVKINGLYYAIKEVTGDDYERWRLVIVDRYGSEKP
ncbi:hypothetical protein MHH96_01150 [Niallia sp. FSL K6-0212]|uniref:hypothetical protein n=1 Tax=Niallia sp. FSL K6-0212 TaxID=2921423 RepID=UPI0030FC2B01